MNKFNIVDLFKEELIETSNGTYKTICPDCGLQGGRTQGFILFKDSNMAHCHSSGKNFNLLETAALKIGAIKCIEGRDKGEKGTPLTGDRFKETLDLIKEEFGEEIFYKITDAMNINIVERFLIIEYNKDGEIKKKLVDIDKVADYIIKKYNIKTIYGKQEESVYVYEDGIWIRKGKGLITAEIEKLLKVYARNNVVKEILEKVKRKTKEDKEKFDIVPTNLTCYNNGVMDFTDINNIKLLPHDKKYNFKTKIPITYDEKADCPQIKNFIENTFYPCDIPQVQEWIGFHNLKPYLLKKAVICTGPKNTGKTVFLNLLSKYVGEKNIAGLSLQKISQGKSFDLLTLKDKNANIHDDLSSKDLYDGGGFKMAVGDGEITGEHKFGDYERFRNTAKMTFACNKIPPVKEVDDDAYFDRWLIWVIENVVTPEKRDSSLINKLTTDEELSGLLNWSLNGLQRLYSNNKFSNERPSEENKDIMVQNSNTLAKFAAEHLEFAAGKKITKDEMYNLYCDFCSKQNPILSPVSKRKVGDNLHSIVSYISDSRDGKNRYWNNVKWVEVSDVSDALKNNMSEHSKRVKQPYNNICCNISPCVTSVIKESDLQGNGNAIKRKKTDREMQFWETEECKNIVVEKTKEEALKWISENNQAYRENFYEALGVGSFKHLNELIIDKKVAINNNKIEVIANA